MFVELIIVLIVLTVITAPVIAFSLLGKYKRLRDNLDQLAEDNSREHAQFQREVADLKKQLAATRREASLAVAESAPRATVPVMPVSHPVAEKKPEAPAIPQPKEPAVVVPPLASVVPPAVVPPQMSAPSAPVHAKPELPAAAKSPAEIKPPTPVAPGESVPLSTPAPQSSVPRVPLTPPRTQAEPPAAARVSASSPTVAYRPPAPRANFQQSMKTVSAIEEALGTNWFLKIGIFIFVVGVALFGIYELGVLGKLGKVGISYLASMALLVGGFFLEKQERYRLLGRAGIGGGWGLMFWSTYAVYHVTAMHVLDSLIFDCILMLLVAITMAVHTLRYRSQFVTGLAFLLGYTTVALSHDTVYSLSSGVILAIGLVAIVLKMGWFELEVFGILSSYLNHLYWLYRLLGSGGAHGRHFAEYHASLALLFFYWITFRLSYVFRKVKTDQEEHVSTVAAILNVGLLLGCMKFQSVQPELAYLALLIVGAAEFLCAQIPTAKRRREAFVVLTIAGTALLLAAAPAHYTYKANDVAILWLVGAEVFLIAGSIVGEVVFRRLGLLIGLLVGIHLAGTDFLYLMEYRASHEDLALASGVLFSVCGAVFYGNALVAGTRWKEHFEDSPDRPLLTIHSYLGAFGATAAAWALFLKDWTALAFAALVLLLAALGRLLEKPHLLVQYTLLGALTLYRAVVLNLHLEAPEHAHIRMRLLTLPILAAAFYLTARLAGFGGNPAQLAIRGAFAAAGSGLLGLLVWYEAPELWQPLAFIALAVVLSEVARALRYQALVWHSHVLTGAAIFTAFTADQDGLQKWHTIPVHAFSALPVVFGGYWIAKRLGTKDERHLGFARVAYTWAGTGVMVWVLSEALRAPWIAVGWIAFAVVPALSTRWIPYSQLSWQANVVGVCALVRAFFFNFNLSQPFWGPITLRVFTISLVGAGLYFLSRRAAPDERFARPIAFLHSFAATGLLAFLASYEYPNGWLAPIWATFALVLAIVDQRFELEELPWQSHILAALTLLRCLSVNLYVTATWHDISVRLLSLAIVAVIFYAMARVVRMPDEWRKRDLHHIYSWAASTIGGLLLWYELQSKPAGIAVAWGAFGLVLFEYGLMRKITQFRYQAYVALVASFTRIFFSNLTSSEPGEFWGPRMYTILPLVLIFFFVYAQLPDGEQGKAGDTTRDRRLHFDVLLAYLGTATVVALLYFQFPFEWVVTSWAVVVFVLLGAALLFNRPIFLHQGLLLTVLVLARGMTHNLFGGSYFTGGEWQGDYLVVSSASAILLASLFFAYRLRERFPVPQNVAPRVRLLASIASRPEQTVFFVPVLLITFMLALEMKTGMITVSWGLEGVAIFLLALVLKERSFRLTGLALLLLCVGKVMALDVWGLQARDRYLTFIVVGAALVFVSFLYTRYRDAIRQYL